MRDIMNPATKLWLWCMAQRRTHVFDGEMRQKITTTKLWLWCMKQRRTHVFNGEVRQNESCYKSRVQPNCTQGMFPKILSILGTWIESTHS